ncbi:hypothetical protein LUU34_00333300 [Aix galericulata]|nr:hypothetical protein LUU34_00333300 [Aix galericulata]
MSVNLGLLFCPVVVVQSCVPEWACHSRGHWAHHSTILEGAIKVQADNELMKMGITKFRWLRRAGVSLNLNLQTSDESRNGIDLGQRLELRCFSWGIWTFFTPVENFASEKERMTCSLNFTLKSPKPRFPFNEVGGGEKNLLEERQKNRRGTQNWMKILSSSRVGNCRFSKGL